VPKLTAVGLGTMYTVHGARGSTSKNIGPMQTLAWLAKDNRPPGERKTGPIKHPFHPGTQFARLETYENILKRTLEVLGLRGYPIALVPVPASCTTAKSLPGERWPARAFARQLAKRGFGTVKRCIVNIQPTQEQTNTGSRTPAHEIAANMKKIATPASGEAVIFVDDIITWGKRMSAVHHVLDWGGLSGALCIAFTNDDETVNCYQPKKRVIDYDSRSIPWEVSISASKTVGRCHVHLPTRFGVDTHQSTDGTGGRWRTTFNPKRRAKDASILDSKRHPRNLALVGLHRALRYTKRPYLSYLSLPSQRRSTSPATNNRPSDARTVPTRSPHSQRSVIEDHSFRCPSKRQTCSSVSS
jgi:hypothetical protein